MNKQVVVSLGAQAKLQLAALCQLERLPLLSPCYCNECKKPLTDSRIMDDRNGWCPRCEGVVTTSWFQVPSWTMAGLVFLFATLLL